MFWLTAILAIAAVIYTLLGLLGIAPKISESEVVNVLSLIVSFLTDVGVLVDPTTKGVLDSKRAFGYESPGDSDEIKDSEEAVG